MASVTLRDVQKSYGDVDVIHNVDLDIDDGEFVVFVGPSGCGKSTLLRMIAGLEAISGGDIDIGGTRVNEVAPSKRGVAMVFQSYALYPHMTVYNNMAFGLKQAKLPTDDIDRRVRAAAEVLHITEYLDRTPKALSGGQRQRVAIGRAIVREPEVFLFDEPLSNLDAALRVNTRLEIARLHQRLGTTMIYVTHDQVEAMTLADKIVVLKDGEVMQVGAPMELFTNPANEFVAGFLGSPKMNFFAGTITEVSKDKTKAKFSGGGLDTKLVRLVSTEKTKDTQARLGIRPQHLRLDNKGPLAGRVTLVERLGTETIVELVNKEDTPFRFASPEVPELTIGQDARFSFDADHAHLF